MTTVRTVIHDRRIELPAPEDLVDGTEVILTISSPRIWMGIMDGWAPDCTESSKLVQDQSHE